MASHSDKKTAGSEDDQTVVAPEDPTVFQYGFYPDEPEGDSAPSGNPIIAEDSSTEEVIDPTVVYDRKLKNPAYSNNHSQSLEPNVVIGPALSLLKDRFELTDLLGVGGMGAVYRAIDRRKLETLDEEPYVAIKVLNTALRKNKEAIIALQRETSRTQELAHPNIAIVYDFDRDGDTVFMTMEYMEGTSLDKVLRKNVYHHMDRNCAKDIVRDVAAAVAYAHSKGVVHSDLKPANIYCTDEGKAKVFDFGIAKAIKNSKQSRRRRETPERTLNSKPNTLEVTSERALTPAYASPEMFDGEDPSYQDDVFSFGCIVYALFSAQHPFCDAAGMKLPANKALEKGIKPERIKSLSRREWQALEKTLRLNRKERTKTISEFESEFFGKSKAVPGLIMSTVALTAVASFGYFYFKSHSEIEATQSKAEALLSDYQREHKTELKRTAAREQIHALLELALLTKEWDLHLLQKLKEYERAAPDDYLNRVEIRRQVSDLYIAKARRFIAAENWDQFELYRERAVFWSEDNDSLTILLDDKDRFLREKQAQEEAARLAAEKAEQERREAEELARIEAEKARVIARQNKIASLLSQASEQARSGNLYAGGKRESAFSLYRDVLTMSPSNATAKNGINTIITHYQRQLEAELKTENLALAQGYLQTLKTLTPNNPATAALAKRVQDLELAHLKEKQRLESLEKEKVSFAIADKDKNLDLMQKSYDRLSALGENKAAQKERTQTVLSLYIEKSLEQLAQQKFPEAVSVSHKGLALAYAESHPKLKRELEKLNEKAEAEHLKEQKIKKKQRTFVGF